jgi:hypothetical protein
VFEAGDGEVSVSEASELTPDHIRQLESTPQRRILRPFRRHDLIDEANAAGILTWQGSGGFSVDASVRIEGEDRAGIERLVRYCVGPLFALERLLALDSTPVLASLESRLLYRFQEPDVHDRTELLLTPLSPSSASPSSSRPRVSIVTATTAFWLRTPDCCPTSWPSVGQHARSHLPRRPHLCQPTPGLRPCSCLPWANPLGRPAPADLRRPAAAVSRGWRRDEDSSRS